MTEIFEPLQRVRVLRDAHLTEPLTRSAVDFMCPKFLSGQEGIILAQHSTYKDCWGVDFPQFKDHPDPRYLHGCNCRSPGSTARWIWEGHLKPAIPSAFRIVITKVYDDVDIATTLATTLATQLELPVQVEIIE